MNRQENQKTIYILLGILSVFVIWLALMVAGCYEEDIKLFELLDRLTVAMNNPTHITFNEYSLKAVLIFLFFYAMAIGVYFSSSGAAFVRIFRYSRGGQISDDWA